jgi:hypothetical protein
VYHEELEHHYRKKCLRSAGIKEEGKMKVERSSVKLTSELFRRRSVPGKLVCNCGNEKLTQERHIKAETKLQRKGSGA